MSYSPRKTLSRLVVDDKLNFTRKRERERLFLMVFVLMLVPGVFRGAPGYFGVLRGSSGYFALLESVSRWFGMFCVK